MFAIRVLCLLIGVVLLAIIIVSTDIYAAIKLIQGMGWGILLVTVAYSVISFGDTLSFHVLTHKIPMTIRNFYKLWKIRLVGEAYNQVLPLGGLGGEPIKAVLLKQSTEMDLEEITASLFAAKTVNIVTLIIFLAVGFLLMGWEKRISPEFFRAAGLGLAVLSLGILGFFLIQRMGLLSVLFSRLLHRLKGRFLNVIAIISNIEHRLYECYRYRKYRFLASLFVALIVWVVSIVEVYLVLYFLGYPISWTEAWIIESGAQLVKAGTFFIPGSIGAFDGAFLLLCGMITGSPVVGAAVAVVRRLREISWTAFGFAIGIFRLKKYEQGKKKY